jgi:hypothetical protein
LLRQLRDQPGRTWAQVPGTLSPTAILLPAHWLATALDCRSRLRPSLFGDRAHTPEPVGMADAADQD